MWLKEPLSHLKHRSFTLVAFMCLPHWTHVFYWLKTCFLWPKSGWAATKRPVCDVLDGCFPAASMLLHKISSSSSSSTGSMPKGLLCAAVLAQVFYTACTPFASYLTTGSFNNYYPRATCTVRAAQSICGDTSEKKVIPNMNGTLA